jgi:hypothetical protein
LLRVPPYSLPELLVAKVTPCVDYGERPAQHFFVGCMVGRGIITEDRKVIVGISRTNGGGNEDIHVDRIDADVSP